MNQDARGTFRELWRESWTQAGGVRPFVQANLSRSNRGVLRGLHFHLRQTDLWIVLEGRAHVSLVDLRGRLAGVRAQPDGVSSVHADVLEAGEAIIIPEGVAHGFWALEPVALLYLVTDEYDGTDEHGFAWGDPDAGAIWPAGRPLLSERDSAARPLGEAITTAQRSAQTSSR